MKIVQVKVILGILLLISGFFIGRVVDGNGKRPVADTTFIEKVVPGDIRLVEIETTVPDFQLIDTGAYEIIEVMQQVDTSQILADYFRTRQYEDTLTDDTSFRAVYQATIHRNRLTDFRYQHQNLRETSIRQTVIKNYNTGLFAGITLSGNEAFVNLSASALYLNKREAYGLSVGLLGEEYTFSYYRKISWPEFRLRPP
jgi:hypothetical protein